jgi:pectinesterase
MALPGSMKAQTAGIEPAKRAQDLAGSSSAPASGRLPTLFLIGDSTVRNGQGDGANGQWGWGEPVAAYFDPAKINVVNRARGGRSSRTFQTEGLWDQVLADLKPGDFVLMQFGHNDTSPINDDSRARGTLPGTGEDTQEIDNLLTKRREVVHNYGWYLRRFVADAKAKGAVPIVCSPVPRHNWKDGKPARGFEGYRRWAADVARSAGVRFVDLNEIVTRRYEAMGPEKVEPLFIGDHTHTSRTGAELNAACVIAGLKALEDNPLAPYFSAKAEEVSAAPSVSRPDAVVAADGSGNFKTVQEAVNAAPADKTRPFLIHIKPGTYKEKLTVPKEKGPITFLGEDAATTILTFDDHARTLGADGKEIGTSRSASILVQADDFAAENITFANSAGPVAQAVAMNVWSDRGVFRRCRFLGWQDTLLVNRNRQYFEDCYIEGHVDFIFGASAAWFERCRIHCRGSGYITAASTPQEQPFGYVFSHCRITAEPGIQVYLGRPWRPYASVTFLHTEMPAEIRPEGWENWRNPENEKTARYAEYRSAGPGASPEARAPWSRQLTEAEAKAITREKALGGWEGRHPL